MHRTTSCDETDVPDLGSYGKPDIAEISEHGEGSAHRTDSLLDQNNRVHGCKGKLEVDNTKSGREIQPDITSDGAGALHHDDDIKISYFSSLENRENGDVTDKMTRRDSERKERQINAAAKQQKINVIQQALVRGDSDALQKAAASEWGLVKDTTRRKAWPVLVGVNVFETSPRPSMEEIENHPYYNQVVMDVNRSIKRFPPSIKETQRLAMQDQLVFLIMRILLKHSELHYYQGYHDICVTFLLVLGEEIAFTVVDKLSMSHLRIFMDETMERTTEVLNYIYPLIRKESPTLYEFLEQAEVGVIFCLSWVITWFGHVLNKYSDVVRLFDFFIISHPWMPLYLSAAIVLYRQEEILQEVCDMACVHSLLTHIPDNLPLQNLVVSAQQLFENYPPSLLKKEGPLKLRQPHRRNRGRGGNMSLVATALRNIFPEPKWTLSLAVATAVVMYAILYQTCKSSGIDMG